ncbi:MAG TPA: hydrogenase maturation protease, partial [Longimicrobiales bacterium]|nr:hydrogenase maturation protease [Longimicrobiales bacterium]
MIEAETVVLGVGSPLMGDDGLGVAAVEMLRERWSGDQAVVFLDGGTWGMRVLPYIEGARRLLVLDAIRKGEEPGTLVRLEKDD